MRGVWKPLFLLALVALLALALSACGSGSDDTTGGSSTATAQETTATAEDQGESPSGFLVPGGDNSIQTFGSEADAAEVAAATTVLSGYLDARAKGGDWDLQCSYLAKSTVKPLEELAARSAQLKGKGCPAILELLTGEVSASTRVNTLDGDIDSLRVEGDRAFALYHGSDGVDYFVQLVEEGGEWKIAALTPSELS